VSGDTPAPASLSPSWDANLYLRFADLRLRPALDLMGRLDGALAARAGHAVYDLGCGAGNITRILAERFPTAPVVGVDSSEAMLAKARTQTSDLRISFRTGDLASFRPDASPAILYSNAAYHWLENHLALFPDLVRLLPPGGQLAIQMPRNHQAPSHALMPVAAERGPWRERLAGVRGIAPVADPDRYWDALRPHCSALEIWETVYQQPLTGPSPVAEFTSGTGLRPYLDALAEPERTAFYKVYCELVGEAYPRRPDGTTLFPFRRLFIVATR